jgi:hypothetical protein
LQGAIRHLELKRFRQPLIAHQLHEPAMSVRPDVVPMPNPPSLVREILNIAPARGWK